MTRHAALALLLLAPPLPADPPPLFEKKVCTTDVLLVPKEKATVVPDWKLREVEVNRVVTPALEFVEEKRCVTEMTLQTREVEQFVTVTESRPVTVTDPRTGKCRTEYQLCPVVKSVKVKVSEVVPVTREVVIRVPKLKAGPEVVLKAMQLDKTTAPAIERRFDAVVTPNVNKVALPVPIVVPPCVGCPRQ